MRRIVVVTIAAVLLAGCRGAGQRAGLGSSAAPFSDGGTFLPAPRVAPEPAMPEPAAPLGPAFPRSSLQRDPARRLSANGGADGSAVPLQTERLPTIVTDPGLPSVRFDDWQPVPRGTAPNWRPRLLPAGDDVQLQPIP